MSITPQNVAAAMRFTQGVAQTVKKARSTYQKGYSEFQKQREAAKRIQRNFRAIRNQVRMDFGGVTNAIGHDPGTGTAKTDIGAQQTTLVATRVLNTAACLNMSRGSGLNDRERDIIDLRGFKVCISAQNLRTNAPMFLNVAMVTSKFDPTQAPGTAGFFRGEGASRGTDFADARTGTEFRCLSINTDKYYIQKHMRMSMHKFNTNQKDFLVKEFYIPIKRQIRFDTSGGTSLNRQFFLVWWCDTLLAPSGGASVANAMNFQYKITTYFREPKR